jgi:glycosyltransferase involved in cell wall biosynthesis
MEIPVYDIAFLLAPDIPIPSASGNAIATLVTTLAASMQYRSLIFSTQPDQKLMEDQLPLQYGIAYYKKPIKQSVLDKWKYLSIIKYFLITPIRYGWRQYAKDAAEACIKLNVKCLVVEDVADFGWVVRHTRKHGIKVILHQHAFTQRNYQNYLWKRIERNLDKVIFVAEKTRVMTEKKHGPIDVMHTVIYNGVDLDHYDPELWVQEGRNLRHNLTFHDQQTVLTFIGRFTASKGILEIMEAYNQMQQNKLGFLLVCSRDQAVDPSFQSRFNELKAALEKKSYKFQILENVPQDEMPIIYAASNIIIVPSVNYYEGLPKVVSEALAMGVPVVASDRGGIWELLSEGVNGWKIMDPVSPNTICDVLIKVVGITENEMKAMKEHILLEDRPRMDQQRMIKSFQKEIFSLVDTPTR